MRNIFEKLINISNSLPPTKQTFFIKLLDELNSKICFLVETNESLKAQISGTKENQYNDNLKKAVDVLKLLGFNEVQFVGLNPDFLNWLIKQTTVIKKYNPKLMNYYLLISMQQAYFLTLAENDGNIPNYIEVRNTMLTFNDKIENSEISINDLIKKIDGKN